MSPVFIAAGVWMASLQATAIAAWNQARAVQPVAYFIGVVVLGITARLTLTSATVVFCCSLVAQLGFAWWRSRALLVNSEPAGDGFVGELYGFGARVWLANVPRLVNVRFDQLMLSVLPAVAAADLGVYAVAASLSWLALPAAIAFGAVAFPAIASAGDEPSIRRIERESLIGSAAVAAVTLTVACVAAPWVVPLLFGSAFDESVVCLWLLAPGTIFLAVNRVLADLLQGRGRPLSTSIGEGAGVVLTVSLVALLVPPFGIRGAAAASSIAYVGVAAVLYARLRIIRRSSVSPALEVAV
jgi:O-antigen/teichoic acid export membrane protein